MFLSKIEELEEAMSFASYMDVTDLRLLYYGRNSMYATFSDTDKLETSGFDGNELKRPTGYVSYTINDIVARKVSTHLLYAHVFRARDSGGGFVSDVKNFTLEEYNEAVKYIRTLNYLNQEDVEWFVELVSSNLRLRRPIERLWALTRAIVYSQGKRADDLWARILLDIGYTGFSDVSGTGLLGKRNKPVTLILDKSIMNVIDIVEVQKYRDDKRNRISDNVKRHNRLSKTHRNRIAKRRTR